ncbi:MAG: hypothetical protein AAF750_15555 [Planctomycetota bacterium]
MPGFNGPAASGFNGAIASGFNALGEVVNPTLPLYLLRWNVSTDRHEVKRIRDGVVQWTAELPLAATDLLSPDPYAAAIAVGPQGVVAVVDTSYRKNGETHYSFDVKVLNRETGAELHSASWTDTGDLFLYKQPCEVDVDADGRVFILTGANIFRFSSDLASVATNNPPLFTGSLAQNDHVRRRETHWGYSLSLSPAGVPFVPSGGNGCYGGDPDALTFSSQTSGNPLWFSDSLGSSWQSIQAWLDDFRSIRGHAGSSFSGPDYPTQKSFYAGNQTIRAAFGFTPFGSADVAADAEFLNGSCFWSGQPTFAGGREIRSYTAAQNGSLTWSFAPEDAVAGIDAAQVPESYAVLADSESHLYLQGRVPGGVRFMACVMPSDTPEIVWSVLDTAPAVAGHLTGGLQWRLDTPGQGSGFASAFNWS